MRAKLLVAVCLSAMLSIASRPLVAHHGTAAFDTSTTVTLMGTMSDFQFVNPHVQLFFDVKNDNGEVEHWQAELTAPNKLLRAGWTKHTLKPRHAGKARQAPQASRHDPYGAPPERVSPQAFSTARQRMPDEFWVALFCLLGQRFEQLYGAVVRWRHGEVWGRCGAGEGHV